MFSSLVFSMFNICDTSIQFQNVCVTHKGDSVSLPLTNPSLLLICILYGFAS